MVGLIGRNATVKECVQAKLINYLTFDTLPHGRVSAFVKLSNK